MRENREIKFRALDHMNKWQYGYYRFIKNSPVNGKEINQHTIHNGSYEELIRPETIGQYTGLKDSTRTKEFPEGKEIFEGDKVKLESFSPSEYIVEFIEGAFCFTHPKITDYPIDINMVYGSTGPNVIIIGTIHD